jgi:hypothetical protein
MNNMKHDGGKPRFDLMTWRATAQVIDVLTFGAQTYAPRSWATVPDAYRRYFAAALRHLWARALGERFDPESGLPHLAHAACNVLFICELDDGGEGTQLGAPTQPTRDTITPPNFWPEDSP